MREFSGWRRSLELHFAEPSQLPFAFSATMWRDLSVILAIAIYAAALPGRRSDDIASEDRIKEILSSTAVDRPKVPNIPLTKTLNNADLVSLVNKIMKTLSRNGTLTEDGSLMLKDLVANYTLHRGENVTVNDVQLDNENGLNAMKDFLQNLKLKNGDFDYSVVRSVHNEIDIEEEEEETDDPQAKDQIVVDYIKNIDKTIAVEDEEGGQHDPDDKQLQKLFRIMSSQQ